jgi:tRNA threonylcarbamoyladenosine biosynthesis protein TsaE
LGAEDEVSSPSFTINNTYESPGITVEHFDFYRLENAGLLAEQLHEDIFRDKTVVAVEWGDLVRDVLPDNKIVVHITVDHDESRLFRFSYTHDRTYVLEGIIA